MRRKIPKLRENENETHTQNVKNHKSDKETNAVIVFIMTRIQRLFQKSKGISYITNNNERNEKREEKKGLISMESTRELKIAGIVCKNG